LRWFPFNRLCNRQSIGSCLLAVEQVEREARGPDVPEFRDNIVHVLGTFMDEARELEEYAALDAVRMRRIVLLGS
jgi:hypothetical protein